MVLHVRVREESFPSDETSACTILPTTKPPRRRRRPARRRSDASSMIALACILSMMVCPDGVFGFVPAQSVAFRRRTENIMSLRMSSVAVAGVEFKGRRRSSFKDRMRNIVVKDRGQSADAKVGEKNGRPSNVKECATLDDYKVVVGDERDKLVVVRFYATWCKACRAMAPYFYKLAQTHQDIQFVEVPVTDKNANLHQGLGVPSLPYGHIYHPQGGLVEELKINRRHFPKFQKVVHSYAQTNCDLIDGDTTNPYPDPEKESAGAGAGANRSAKVPV